jgi:hypothetical protein
MIQHDGLTWGRIRRTQQNDPIHVLHIDDAESLGAVCSGGYVRLEGRFVARYAETRTASGRMNMNLRSAP